MMTLLPLSITGGERECIGHSQIWQFRPRMARESKPDANGCAQMVGTGTAEVTQKLAEARKTRTAQLVCAASVRIEFFFRARPVFGALGSAPGHRFSTSTAAH